jgi:hypothetical protein
MVSRHAVAPPGPVQLSSSPTPHHLCLLLTPANCWVACLSRSADAKSIAACSTPTRARSQCSPSGCPRQPASRSTSAHERIHAPGCGNLCPGHTPLIPQPSPATRAGLPPNPGLLPEENREKAPGPGCTFRVSRCLGRHQPSCKGCTSRGVPATWAGA